MQFKKSKVSCQIAKALAMISTVASTGAYATETKKEQSIEKNSIERITVSARKRVKSVQDIGVSVNSFNASDIRDLGIGKTEDLVKVVPSLDIKDANGQGNINITLRGIGLNDFSSNNNPTVGIYFDEVFYGFPAMMSFALFDIERIEVLKGPQGTLYGRNTTGGAITFQTARPEHETSGFFNIGYSNFDTSRAEGALNIDVTDDLALRLSGFYENQGKSHFTNYATAPNADGVYEISGPGENFGSATTKGLRLSALYEADNLTIYSNVHIGSKTFPLIPLEQFGAIDPDTFELCSEFVNNDLAGMKRNCTDFFGFSDPEQTGPRGGSYTLDQFPDNKLDTTGAVFKVDLETTVGTFSSISGWEKFERSAVDDISGNPFTEYLDLRTTDDIEEFSQEFRLSHSTELVDYVVGVFWSRDEVSSSYFANGESLLGALLDPDNPPPADLDYLVSQETDTAAIFSNLEWPLTDTLSLITGLRYSKESKDFTVGGDVLLYENFVDGGNAAYASDSAAQSALRLPVIESFTQSMDTSKISGQLALEWKLQDDLLVYSSYSQGFKSGGYFGHIGFETDVYQPFDEETLNAYEIGVKTRLLDGNAQINMAAFYYDYQDFQATIFDGITSRLQNVDSATIQGLELDAWFTPTENLTLKVSAGLLDTEVNDTTGTYDGHEVSNAPGISGSLFASYELPLSNDFNLSLQGDIKYSDSMFKDVQNDPMVASESFTTLGVRVVIAPESYDWQLALWAQNLTDELYIAQGYSNTGPDFGMAQAFYNKPRTFGMTFSYNF